MRLTEFKQGYAIFKAGEPMRQLLLITKGEAETKINGQVFRFEKGDMLGLCALNTGSYGYTYTAVSDVMAAAFDVSGVTSLETRMQESAETANLIVQGMCRNLVKFLQYRATLKQEADKAYALIKEVFPLYERLCTLYALTPKKLPGVLELTSASDNDPVEDFAHNFYVDIKETEPSVSKAFFAKPGISIGFVRQGAGKTADILRSCNIYQEHLKIVSRLLLNGSGHDLFALITELHVASSNIKGAAAAVEMVMSKVNGLLTSMAYVDRQLYQRRVKQYKETLAAKLEAGDTGTSNGGVKQNLADSMDFILKYSNLPAEFCNKFTRDVHEFTGLNDRASSDDSIARLRRELTVSFNKIYQRVFINSLQDPAPSTIIKMFLNFGYVDANLAGHDNADYLYSIADSLIGDPKNGVYTISEWLTAIYKGKKDPCRNEFDMDFPAYVNEMKQNRKINADEEARLLQDTGAKLRFELENIFPVVNKLTYGFITTFCPLFASNNVQRGLEASLVTPVLIKETLDEIRGIDFSAFARETIYSNPEAGVPRESIHVEILPDIILMPNVGSRGIMWQDIEGRKRATPSRMFMPLFLLTEFKTLLVRLTGEFRWEMCKRVQGSRWQDITDRSLTSEYSDYLQFYRTNRDLSPEVKATVKTELSRARNNYKNVFVANYIDWILHESNGTPRLNRHARKMMLTYCPFTAQIRASLTQNPQFAEHIKRYEFMQQQREQLLTRVIAKLNQSSEGAPRALLKELEYVKK